jgi:hypothetical protein
MTASHFSALWFAKTPAPREINHIATAISPPLDQRCHIVTLVFRERLQEQTEFSIATAVKSNLLPCERSGLDYWQMKALWLFHVVP